MNEVERWNTALFIAIDDLTYPNSVTRNRAIDEECLIEFFEIRQQLIEHAHGLFAGEGSLRSES